MGLEETGKSALIGAISPNGGFAMKKNMKQNELRYDFLAPQHVVFGWGRRTEAGTLAKTLGHRAFIVCGLPEAVAATVIDELTASMQAAGVAVALIHTIDHEPEVEDVDRLAELLRQEDAGDGDFLLGIGGGAAMDLAKAAAAMATNRQSDTVKDYLENVGRDLQLVNRPLPIMAMPTTAGTGAEATKNAVISSYDPPFKKSLRNEQLVPRIALVDPQLCVTAPPEVTAAGGMDAITQLIESYISRKAQPIPQALSISGLKMAIPALAQAVADGSSRSARERMSHAAMLSGMALANSGLGLAHGVAPALGIHCRVPHGVACAIMLPVALKVNSEACQSQLAMLSHAVFGRSRTTSAKDAVKTLIHEIQQLCKKVGTPGRLSQVGVTMEQIPAIVASSRGSSMSGNPVELSDEELTKLLENIL
jgi:alcohol dehydrogenase class IV